MDNIINHLRELIAEASPDEYVMWLPHGDIFKSSDITTSMFEGDTFGRMHADAFSGMAMIKETVFICSLRGCRAEFIFKWLPDGSSAQSYELAGIEHLRDSPKMAKLVALIMAPGQCLVALYLRTGLVCADLYGAFETCLQDLGDVSTIGHGVMHALDKEQEYGEWYNKLLQVMKLSVIGMAQVS